MKYKQTRSNRSGNEVTIRGLKCSPGIKIIRIETEGCKSAPIPLQHFRGAATKVSAALDRAGIIMLGDDLKELKQHVADFDDYQEGYAFSRPGWADGGFALSSGKILKDGSVRYAVPMFPKDNVGIASKGALEDWTGEVANRLIGHRLGEFCMMVALAPALLHFRQSSMNFGFELSGGGGTGKTTLALCAASVLGPPEKYITTMNSTATALDASMPRFNDHPLIVEEWTMASLDAGGQAGPAAGRLIFALSDGRTKRRYGKNESEQAKFIWLSTTNAPWSEICGNLSTDIAQAVGDRMITIPVDGLQQMGVFDRRVLKGRSIATAAKALFVGTTRNYGTAYPAFIQAIIDKIQSDGDQYVADYIDKQMKNFRQKAFEKNLSAGERIIDAFGLIYATGRLSQKLAILPGEYSPHSATFRALRKHIDAHRDLLRPVDRLRILARHPDVLDVRKRQFNRMQPKETLTSPCIIRTSSDGDEMIFTHEQFVRVFPNHKRVLKDREVSKYLHRDNDRPSVKRQLNSHGGPQRVYCFRLDQLLDQA